MCCCMILASREILHSLYSLESISPLQTTQISISIIVFLCSAQQAFESLKVTFGDDKCFLVPINSQQTPSSNDIVDPWLKFLRRQTKSDMSVDSGSAPKTPQDVTVTTMPTSVQIPLDNTSPPSPPTIQPLSNMNEETVDHPLSPTQEQTAETIV